MGLVLLAMVIVAPIIFNRFLEHEEKLAKIESKCCEEENEMER